MAHVILSSMEVSVKGLWRIQARCGVPQRNHRMMTTTMGTWTPAPLFGGCWNTCCQPCHAALWLSWIMQRTTDFRQLNLLFLNECIGYIPFIQAMPSYSSLSLCCPIPHPQVEGVELVSGTHIPFPDMYQIMSITVLRTSNLQNAVDLWDHQWVGKN